MKQLSLSLFHLLILLCLPLTLVAQQQSLTLHINGKAVANARVNHVQELPSPDPLGEFVFMGWSTSPIPTTTIDLPQLATSLSPELTDLYAVYQQELECSYFQEVEKLQANKEYVFAGRVPNTQDYVALDANNMNNTLSTPVGSPIQVLPAPKSIILPPVSPSQIWNTNIKATISSFKGSVLYVGTKIALKGSENTSWEKPLTYYDKYLKDTYRIYINSGKKFYMTKAEKPEGSPVQIFEKTEGTLRFYTTQPAYTLELSEGRYATFSSAEAVKIPTGVQAFSGILQGNSIKLQEIHNIIPANTGVILESQNTRDYSFVKTYEPAAPLSNNAFEAAPYGLTLKQMKAKEKSSQVTYFALAHLNNKTAFYKVGENVSIPPQKAYILLPTAQVRTAPLTFDLTPTAITPLITASPQAFKSYDLSGRIIASPQSGQIYIQNGQKYIAP